MRRKIFHNIVTNGSVRMTGKLISISTVNHFKFFEKYKRKILYRKSTKGFKCEKTNIFCELCQHRRCDDPVILRKSKRKDKHIKNIKLLIEEYDLITDDNINFDNQYFDLN